MIPRSFKKRNVNKGEIKPVMKYLTNIKRNQAKATSNYYPLSH